MVPGFLVPIRGVSALHNPYECQHRVLSVSHGSIAFFGTLVG
jgi:hypothetical protein